MFPSAVSLSSKKSLNQLSNRKFTTSSKLFVGNLATQTTSHHLQSVFSPFGQVIECVKVRERYGFVRFSSSNEAEKALNACHGLQLNGYPMMVEYAQNEILISPKSSRIQMQSYRSIKKHTDCSTSDYSSQSERVSSRSSSSLSVIGSGTSCDEEESIGEKQSNTEQRSTINNFVGDQILNFYDHQNDFNGRDIDPRDPIFIWNFAFYPDVSINPFVKRTDIKTLLERRIALYSQS